MEQNYLISILLFIYLSEKIVHAQNDVQSEKVYIPPGNIGFPYGDEYQINTNINLNEINRIVCTDTQFFIPPQGKCPFPPEDPSDMKLTCPYINCPEFKSFGLSDTEILGDEIVPPAVQCKICDVKQTSDNEAVLLSCSHCYDIVAPGQQPGLNEKDILYRIYFIEIANYTSVNITGEENF